MIIKYIEYGCQGYDFLKKITKKKKYKKNIL